jgi:hypothetical protein
MLAREVDAGVLLSDGVVPAETLLATQVMALRAAARIIETADGVPDLNVVEDAALTAWVGTRPTLRT